MLFLVGIMFFLISHLANGDVHIGNGLYLPDTNLMLPIDSQYTIFEGDISRFLREEPLAITYNNKEFSRDTTSVYRQFSQTFGLTAPIKAVQFSVEQSFQHISGGETNITALSIDVLTYSKKLSIRNEARVITRIPLRKVFLDELRALPEFPVEDGNWILYLRFMRKWGSHYVNAVFYGSWMQQWSTASSSRTYSERDFQANACARVEGPQSKFSSVEGCIGVGNAEKQAATRFSMFNRLVVRGGDPSTASKISSGQRTNELVQQFISEGLSSEAAVRYEFTPIWTQVFAAYPNMASKEAKIASAMEAYYEGFLAFGCPRRLTINNIVLQEFRHSTSNNLYTCVRRCEGCSVVADCNRIGQSQICKCFGNSCVKITVDDRAEVQSRRDDLRQNEGPNRSCEFQGSSCRCTGTRETGCVNRMKTIWDQSGAIQVGVRDM